MQELIKNRSYYGAFIGNFIVIQLSVEDMIFKIAVFVAKQVFNVITYYIVENLAYMHACLVIDFPLKMVLLNLEMEVLRKICPKQRIGRWAW